MSRLDATMRIDEILAFVEPNTKIALGAFAEARHRMPAINARARLTPHGVQVFVGTWSMILMRNRPEDGVTHWEATLMEVSLPLNHILDEFDTYPAALAFFRVVLTALAESEKEIPF